MTSALAPSFLVAALFAWHPLSVESVAWVSERRDVLSMLFWLLTLHAYVTYTRAGGWRNYGWVIFLFACGLMSKPMVVTLPCVMLLLDGWPLCRWDRLAPLEQSVASRRFKLGYLVGEKIPLLGDVVVSQFLYVPDSNARAGRRYLLGLSTDCPTWQRDAQLCYLSSETRLAS